MLRPRRLLTCSPNNAMMDKAIIPSVYRGGQPYEKGGKEAHPMRYYSLNTYLQKAYGKKLYKIALDGGMTCPNRDGTLGERGCIFCSQGGSGDFASDASLSITEQIEHGKSLIRKKYSGSSYIAYFQAYTNTYAPLPELHRIFTEAVRHPDIQVLSVATRPDCLSPESIGLLEGLNRSKPVWVELGLQTIHASTARFIRRGYDLPVFEKAVSDLHRAGIAVIAHTILGLPGEDLSMTLATMHYLNHMKIDGIKLQLLHILEGTDLADEYRRNPFPVLSMEEYLALLGKCIAHLREDIVIHRLTGDGPKNLLIAPMWSADKKKVLNRMHAYFKEQDIRQGKEL